MGNFVAFKHEMTRGARLPVSARRLYNIISGFIKVILDSKTHLLLVTMHILVMPKVFVGAHQFLFYAWILLFLSPMFRLRTNLMLPYLCIWKTANHALLSLLLL